MELTMHRKKKLTKARKPAARKFVMAYHLMLLPGIILLILFNFLPMFGIIMAFQDFVPARGFLHSTWVGLAHFQYMFSLPDSFQIFRNTIVIAGGKIIFGTLVPIIFALLLNEIRVKWFKQTVQTIVYLPNFLSWVVLGAVFTMILANEGMVNQFLGIFGIQPISFLASNTWFQPIMIITDVWKGYGYATIIYLAAMTSINPDLYESAALDGANRWQNMIHITLPAIMPMVILVATLSLGSILSAGFDQIYNLYNPIVYPTGDIIDTYVYRFGLRGAQYSFGAAVGLLKSVISLVLIVISYKLAKKFAHYTLF
ncbi:ABC transporter permease [Schleiferilactobacillus harbinensis]|jgi:putative aldouronate transport system permease protein|uniref:ABC transporter permease n=1 Tax=Schleiferilactobacillus harbinensis TaxID=304207 RepID=UPI001175A4E4|nr:ABC transporter permease subunit [Schleiferilactobacillus harbinensis]GEK05267.1 putative multiple-sugar transport system permease YteP [Schleiferilactobacillus harbinensis]